MGDNVGMRIAFLSSYPPTACGVGDYMAVLEQHLMKVGVETRVFYQDKWPTLMDGPLFREIRDFQPDIIHIQYPTVSFGTSLFPQTISARLWKRKPQVVATLHEFSQAHLLRKIAMVPFALFAREIIFTTSLEQSAFARWIPGVRKRSTMIPIGSNIPFLPLNLSLRDPLLVAYFGLIRPAKGIEDFIELTRLCQQRDLAFKFMILGNPQEKTRAYYENLREETKNRGNLEWLSGLDAQGIAEQLARATYAYLPFPDGVSERRGSLLAVMGNGLNVISTRGPQTTTGFSEILQWAADPQEALERLTHLQTSPDERERLSLMGRALVAKYSWEAIVREHLRLYSSLI